MELKEIQKSVAQLIAIQCADGNWNYNPYMHGMVNGMILIESCLYEHSSPVPFLDAPDKWIEPKPKCKWLPSKLQ